VQSQSIDKLSRQDYIIVPTYKLTLETIGIRVQKMKRIKRVLEPLLMGWLVPFFTAI
jgi:hypothetical protein